MAPLTIPINEDGIFKDMPFTPDDWADPALVPTVDAPTLAFFAPIITEQVRRLYAYRHIGVHPYERFRDNLAYTLATSVTRWGPVLSRIRADGGLDITAEGGTGTKDKTVTSQYPNESINPQTHSYASQADDHVGRVSTDSSPLKAMLAYNDPDNPYRDAVTAIVEDAGVCFSTLIY